MTTTRERMKQLSGLLGAHSAREHFLAITQGTGVDRLIFASSMVVSVEDDQLSVIQHPSELSVSETRAQTETTQKDKPNRITAMTRPARVDVVTRQAALFVMQKAHTSAFVRTLPNTISARRKRTVKQIS